LSATLAFAETGQKITSALSLSCLGLFECGADFFGNFGGIRLAERGNGDGLAVAINRDGLEGGIFCQGLCDRPSQTLVHLWLVRDFGLRR
jgi:hypothetical protein